MRIVKDYNQYVMRNLDRGYSRKDLGVSYVKVRTFVSAWVLTKKIKTIRKEKKTMVSVLLR